MDPEEHAKLIDVAHYSLPATLLLSKLRHCVAKKGYSFPLSDKGSPILLVEAARILDCQPSKDLARQLLEEIKIHTMDF